MVIINNLKTNIMKAIVLKDFGDVENLVEREIPIPDISENEVLVEVKAFAINPVDIKTRKGKSLASSLKIYDPIILGWDISGSVKRTGKAVDRFKEGDEVFGMINFPGHGKAYAEYVAAPATHLSLKPANISHSEAAGASLAALTAWQILKEHVKPGDKVLIHAAAGGVGHFAVQMARSLGASTTGTASFENKDFVLSLGASQFVNYKKEKFEDSLNGFDFVLDTIGGDYIDRSLKVLKPGGTIVCIPSGSAENIVEKASESGMKGLKFLVHSNGADMKEIAGLMERGEVKTFILKEFALSEIQDAHLQIETGNTKGKVVVVLK